MIAIALTDVGDERDRALREHLVEALDVVGHPRHQAADRDAIEERGALARARDRRSRCAGRASCAGRRAGAATCSQNDDTFCASTSADVQQPHRAAARRSSPVRMWCCERVLEQRTAARARSAIVDEHERDPASEQRASAADVLPQPARSAGGRRPCRGPASASAPTGAAAADGLPRASASCELLGVELGAVQLGVDAARARAAASCVPRSTIWPWSSTRIWSASLIAATRCEISTAVRPLHHARAGGRG